MTTTEKKKTQKLTFRQLLSKIAKTPSLLKTAALNGWLLGENFLTRLTDNEMDVVRELYKNNPDAKKSDGVKLALPDQVGVLCDVAKIQGKRVRIIASEHSLYVDGLMYMTMKHRHPKAYLYLSPDRKYVIFSERTTVAMLPIQ